MPNQKKLLVLDDDPLMVSSVTRLCKSRGYDVQGFTEPEPALEAIAQWDPAIILLDINMPVSGLDLLRQFTQTGVTAKVIVMTGDATIENAVTAMKEGAFDFVSKPFEEPDCLFLQIERALAFAALEARAAMPPAATGPGRYLIGESKGLRKVQQLVARVGPSESTVLIYGETGSGKEMVARELHAASNRAGKPFCAINCAAFTENLIESELFGHEKGSFTGAQARRDGVFQEANKGTLFLDEIGELTAPAQAKLLRALQEKEVRRVGGSATERVDVRVLAATNRDLALEVKHGRFREDLYYRLNVIQITVPPLRERKDDIAVLCAYFLKTLQAETEPEKQKRLAPQTLKLLEQYSWPGNVRELLNVMQRALVLTEGADISPLVLPPGLLDNIEVSKAALGLRIDLGYQEAKQAFTENFDRYYVEALLASTDGNMSRAAEYAGMDRSNFRKLVVRAGALPTGSAEE